MLLDMTFDEIMEHLSRQQASRGSPSEGTSGFEGDDMEGLETPFRSVVSGNMALGLSATILHSLGLSRHATMSIKYPSASNGLPTGLPRKNR